MMIIITSPAQGFIHVVNDIDDSYYSVQQASAQEESTSSVSFTPFSQQQDQEAVPEQEGGQQLTTTPANQTVANATNGTAAPEPQPGEPSYGVPSSQCINISSVEYCLLPRDKPTPPGVVCADVHFTNGTSGLYCPSQSTGEVAVEPGTPAVAQTTPTNQTQTTINETITAPFYTLQDAQPTNHTTAINAMWVSEKCPVSQPLGKFSLHYSAI